MADGAGSRLDTIADIVFVVVCMIKLIPVLNIPLWLFIWIAIIALIKIINIISGLVAAHTVMNKVTGIEYSGALVSAVAII